MRPTYLLPFICLSMAALSSAQTSLDSRENFLTTDQRITAYQRQVAADPDNSAPQIWLAYAYVQKTRETTDFNYLNRATKIVNDIEAHGKNYDAQRIRNIIELNWHHFAAVAASARQMAQEVPHDPKNWAALGDALMEIGDYDGAREAFLQMITLRRSLPSYNRMAYYMFETGRIPNGIALMKEAIHIGSKKYPENVAWCWVELGKMDFKIGNLQEADDAYRAAIEKFPAGHAAYAGLAQVEAAEGKLPEAIADYKRAQSIVPMPQYAGALADLYEMTERPAEAKQQKDLIDLQVKLEAAANQKANRTLALLLSNEDREPAEALALAQEDFKARQDIFTYDALAWAQYKNKNYNEAKKASDAALKLGAPEAMLHYHAGMIAYAMGDAARAKTELGAAEKLNLNFDVKQGLIARQTLKELDAVQQGENRHL